MEKAGGNALPLFYWKFVTLCLGFDLIQSQKKIFLFLEKTLQNELTTKPSRIFNMDESGMPLNPKQLM